MVDHSVDNPSTTTDADLADIAAGARVTNGTATPTSVTFGTAAAGVLDHADLTFVAVTWAQAFESLVLYDFATNTANSSPLICKFDTATGLPATPSGGDIVLAPNVSGVFKL